MEPEAYAHRVNLPDGRTVTIHYGDPEDCADCDREAEALAAREAESEAEAVDPDPPPHTEAFYVALAKAYTDANPVYPCRTYPGAFCVTPDCRGTSHSPDDDVDDECCRRGCCTEDGGGGCGG